MNAIPWQAVRLHDFTDRLMLADLLEEAGRDGEAKILRDHGAMPALADKEPVVVDAREASPDVLRIAIDAELRRCGFDPSGAVPPLAWTEMVQDEPLGWATVWCGFNIRLGRSDSGSSVKADGRELLALLRRCEDALPRGVWLAMTELPDVFVDRWISPEVESRGFRQIYRDGDWRFHSFRTNGGVVYSFCPDDPDWLAGHHVSQFSARFPTLEEAVAARDGWIIAEEVE